MDEFGPLDQDPVAMDEEEVADLLADADDDFKVVANKKPNKKQSIGRVSDIFVDISF